MTGTSVPLFNPPSPLSYMKKKQNLLTLGKLFVLIWFTSLLKKLKGQSPSVKSEFAKQLLLGKAFFAIINLKSSWYYLCYKTVAYLKANSLVCQIYILTWRDYEQILSFIGTLYSVWAKSKSPAALYNPWEGKTIVQYVREGKTKQIGYELSDAIRQ